MSKYFMLECTAPEDWDDPALIEGIAPPDGKDSWRFGRRFKSPPMEPVKVTLHADYGIQIEEFWNVDTLLMTRRLHAALLAAGVGNLDVYDAVISHAARDFVSLEYVVCNLVGVVSAANMNESAVIGGSRDGLIDTDFESVSIDESKTRGALMFRLAENTSAVVVHASVKEYLLAQGFDMLTFVPPEDWMG
ncbi:imm11 family protein [Corallococcus llansteffanensis]|uniref:imm11 family protein n=1 Tax=Corallococcus llansteffanensis TaxID=2316731 RepID=UPI00142EEDC4|nr:hypothetical protein [Corallococcus llansteffanensis]